MPQKLNHIPELLLFRTIWSLKIGNAITGSSRSFRINTHRLSKHRTIPKVVNTIIHEYVHCVDFEDNSLDFTHFDNQNTNGEENNTAPWKIGSIAQEFAKKMM